MMMLAPLFALCAVCAQADDAVDIDRFFEDFRAQRDGIVAMEARFTQTDRRPEETLDSSGTIVYVKPRRIVFRYEVPEDGPTYLVDDTRVFEYEPDIRQIQIFDLEDRPETEVFFLGFDDNTDALKEAYDVEHFTPEGEGQGAHGIILRPKEDAANFQEVRLYLRDKDYLPQRIHIRHDADSEVNIVVSDIRVNEAIDPGKAQVFVPEGTRVIENDELVEKVGADGKHLPAAPPEGLEALPSAAPTDSQENAKP